MISLTPFIGDVCCSFGDVGLDNGIVILYHFWVYFSMW
jgi:hypothetical protein